MTGHVCQDVLRATLGEVSMALRRLCFSCKSRNTRSLKRLALKVWIALAHRLVVGHVVSSAHEFQVVGTIVPRREVAVVDDSPLPFERWDRTEQALTCHDPVHPLPVPGPGVPDAHIPFLIAL